jgi:hypothetical protein
MATKTIAQLKTGKNFVDVIDSMFDKSSPVQARGYTSTTPSLVEKFPVHTTETAAALTVTIAMILTGVIAMDPTADRAWTLPTAALAVAGVDGVAVGDCLNFSIINTGTGNADEIITLGAGTGGTLVGSGAVCTVNSVNDAMSVGSGLFKLRFDNVTAGSEAITCYRLA